jgi:hypothetical protein
MNILYQSFYIGKFKIEVPVFIWFLLPAIASILEMSRGEEHFHNFILYKHVFFHTIQQVNLYDGVPVLDFDNHYGPLFSLVIAPFSFLGNYIGCFLWCIFMAWVLYFAINLLPISKQQQLTILLITAVEMMTATHSVEVNTLVTGAIILSFIYIEKGKDIWGVFYIAAGFLVKLLGIVGVGFFLFSKHKKNFLLYGLVWLIVLGCLPMIISSPSFVFQSYIDWYYDLIDKNNLNINGSMQDICVMGMIRRVFNIRSMPNWIILIPAALAYLIPLFRVKEYRHLNFRLSYLALALIGVVIFSTASESPTYVIAVSGVAIWYVMQDDYNKRWGNALLIFTMILTVFSPTDLFPRYIRDNYVITYSLKALPCFTVWLTCFYQLITKRFEPIT